MSRQRFARLERAMRDVRGDRVVFLSHCLLNQNTRYLGGAVCPGVVRAAVEPYLESGTGIVQMPCPEQLTWGGVRKTRLLVLLEHRWVARAGHVLLRIALPYLRRRHSRLARDVVDDIEDYLVSGVSVVGVVGVAGSPSCGVHTTLDLPAALAGIARCPRAPVSAVWMNDTVIDPALRSGDGMFIQALSDELARRRLVVPVTETHLSA